MKRIRAKRPPVFSAGEITLWSASVAVSILSGLLTGMDMLNLAASLVGVTALIFLAKGNPIGQMLILVFSVLYGIISYACAYYGEMLTYLGMTAPMAVVALIAWLRHPFHGDGSVVAIEQLSGRAVAWMLLWTAAVTAIMYPLLKWFGTANLLFSTLSIATSFAAAYLTYKRSTAYALAYALNDIVLIVLWILAARDSARYTAMVVCFTAFLVNDMYGYVNWRRMQRVQEAGA